MNYYKLCRSFWRPSLNRKIDWACEDDASWCCWWTEGFNNTIAIFLPTVLNIPLHHFCHDSRRFRHNITKWIRKYFQYATENEDAFKAWRTARLPWDPPESVNDLMTALNFISLETFGGVPWIRMLFRAFDMGPDVIKTNVGTFFFQQCSDDVYTLRSIAAQADLRAFCCEKLYWSILQ